MGSAKTEIVFLGDTVNTAARIQDVCRQTGDRILASADLIDRIQLLPGIVKRSLGDLRLRGKGVDLALYALSNAAEPRSDEAGDKTNGSCRALESPSRVRETRTVSSPPEVQTKPWRRAQNRDAGARGGSSPIA